MATTECIDKDCAEQTADPESAGWEHVAPDAWLCTREHG